MLLSLRPLPFAARRAPVGSPAAAVQQQQQQQSQPLVPRRLAHRFDMDIAMRADYKPILRLPDDPWTWWDE